MAGAVRSMGVVEDKGSVAVDGLRNTVPCAPGPGIGVVTTMIAATSRGWIFPGWLKYHPSNGCSVLAQHTSERASGGRCCWGEASLLVLCAVDLACGYASGFVSMASRRTAPRRSVGRDLPARRLICSINF